MKKIFSFLKPYWVQVVLVFILVSFSALGTLLLPDYMSKIIGEGISAEYHLDINGVDTIVTQTYCDTLTTDSCTVVQTSDMSVIINYGIKMLTVTLLTSIAAIILMYVSSQVGSKTGRDIRRAIFGKVSQFSLAESENFGTSTLITRSTNDVMQVQNFLMMSLRMILRIPILLIGGIILSIKNIREMTDTSQLIYVLLIGMLALIILIVVAFILVLPLFKMMQKRVDNMTLVTREGINGVRVIRAFGQGKKEVNRFKKVNDELTDTNLAAGRIMSIMNPAVNLIFSLVTVGILYFAYLIITKNQFTDFQSLGNISAVIQYSTQIMFSLLMLTMTFITFPRAQVSGKRIAEILDQEIIVKDEGKSEYKDYIFRGNVKFDDVCFKFGDADENVLNNITFEAKPGQTIAIIGSTGSGKSTIVNLLPRFFDATCGTISIDGVPIRDIPLHDLRNLIGFVPQSAVLFSGTIRDNIAYGKEDATDSEIEEAARIAQAKEFIDSLEDGYDAIIDQGGVNFSGGQKQRLSIARALVRKPKIYVFDDSFSALDFKTDSNLRKDLKPYTKNATVFIVAQRIGTIMDANTILVVHEGRIVGIGTHKELLESCQVYQEIASSQLSEEELAL